MSFSVYSSERYMKEAFLQASLAYEKGEVPVGAVVVCKNKIIARAYNQVETLNDSTAHAEMIAITAASEYLGNKYLDECSLYVTLEPCAMCAGALFWAQLGELVYAADDTKHGFTIKQNSILHPKTKVSKGIMAQESKELLETFFKRLR